MTPQHHRSTTASQKRSEQEGGFALMAVIATAVIASMVAFGVLILAMSHARSSNVQKNRLRAQYAAEAGLVWAKERLWANPAYCGTPDPPAINGVTIDVIVGNCGAGNFHTVQAHVSY